MDEEEWEKVEEYIKAHRAEPPPPPPPEEVEEEVEEARVLRVRFSPAAFVLGAFIGLVAFQAAIATSTSRREPSVSTPVARAGTAAMSTDAGVFCVTTESNYFAVTSTTGELTVTGVRTWDTVLGCDRGENWAKPECRGDAGSVSVGRVR